MMTTMLTFSIALKMESIWKNYSNWYYCCSS